MRSVGGEALQAFVAANVQPATTLQPGAVVKTDGWVGYSPLHEQGYQHAPEVEGAPERATEVLPRVHIIAGNLKRVLDGTHAGRVSNKHMSAYVGGFRFRYNHRSWRDKALSGAFRRVVQESPLT